MEYTKIPDKIYKERDGICTRLKIGESASLRKAKNCITYFSYHQLGITPYAWQHMLYKEIMNNSRNILVTTPRQVGKSHAVATAALHHAIYNILPIESKGGRTVIGIVSRSLDQNKKIIADIRNLMDIGDRHIEKRYGLKGWFTAHLSTKLSDSNSRTHLTFRQIVRTKEGLKPEGKVISEIIAVPPTETARGNTFSIVFMDEAAFFEDDEFYPTVIEPTMRKTGGISIVTTTPNGQKGWFFNQFDPFDEIYKKNPYKRFWLNSSHIESEDERKLVQKRKEQLILAGAERQYQQEYEAMFTVDSTSFFDAERVDAMFDDTLVKKEECKEKTDMGVDIGFKTSRTVITISKKNKDGIIERIYHYRYPEKQDLSLVDDIIALIPKFNVQRVIVDDCPAASNLIQELRKRGVNMKLFNFRALKTSKYVLFKSRLYQGKIKSYPDKLLSTEMKGLIEIEGIRNTRIEKLKTMSDDMIDSFLMSVTYYLDDKKDFKVYDIDELDE